MDVESNGPSHTNSPAEHDEEEIVQVGISQIFSYPPSPKYYPVILILFLAQPHALRAEFQNFRKEK